MKLFNKLGLIFIAITCFTGKTIAQSDVIKQDLSSHVGIDKSRLKNGANDTINWIEDVSKRTVYSSTYFSSNKEDIKILQSSRPVNYYDQSGLLVPINKELRKEGNEWIADAQPYPTYLYADGSSAISLGDGHVLKFGINCSFNDQPLSNNFVVNNNDVQFDSGYSGISKELVYRENGVKYNYIIAEPFVTQLTEYRFSEELNLPKGCRIVAGKEGDKLEKGWAGTMQVIDSENNVVATFHMPVCFDSADNYTRAYYSITLKSGRTYLNINVPEDWINAPERVFPVVVDPLVTGPTSNWTGGSMPSCLLPSFNSDSILVTIPGGVTMTELNITSSYYADPWTTAVMSDGAMTFSTSCAVSQQFTVTGATGNTAGTAYLDNYNLLAPITCCFPEYCTDTSFYLVMNLGRSQPGTGCNTTYIRYDPVTTSWPFQAVVIGKTPEAYAGQWVVPQTPICSNKCTVTGVAYVNYGVAPYTFSHPWSSQTVTQGQNIGCGTGSTTYLFTLDIPNCPDYCDTNFTSLTVPPPVVTDACGNVVGGLQDELVPIKTAPGVTPVYDAMVCSEDQFLIDLIPCVSGATVSWSGNGNNGSSSINDSYVNNSSSIDTVTYEVSATSNGCFSDTTIIEVQVAPLPLIQYGTDPDPIIAGVPVSFSDQTVFNVGNGVLWEWSFGDGESSTDQNPTYMYANPGEYELCLIVLNDNGCSDTLCEMITVVSAEVYRPNVITPNNDGVNDLLAFKYLEFYPDNNLVILNRWGNVILDQDGYLNDWDGEDYAEGVYFYRLTINETDQEYSGFFHIVR